MDRLKGLSVASVPVLIFAVLLMDNHGGLSLQPQSWSKKVFQQPSHPLSEAAEPLFIQSSLRWTSSRNSSHN